MLCCLTVSPTHPGRENDQDLLLSSTVLTCAVLSVCHNHCADLCYAVQLPQRLQEDEKDQDLLLDSSVPLPVPALAAVLC